MRTSTAEDVRPPSSPTVAERSREEEPAQDSERVDSFDVQDVPAAVLCAYCGMSDCSGSCEDLTASGVFVLVPWERRDGSFFRRLFATARATTLDAEPFFERLADGPVGPALSFAIAAETVAALAVTVLVAVPLAVLFPDLARACLMEEESRRSAFVALLLGVPGLAALLVAAHAVHGLSIDLGAQRSGARTSRTRALRFGLYATGWDLVVGPLGVLVLAVTEGPRSVLTVVARATGLPTRATRAFLKNAYRLEGDAATHALRASYLGAGLATVAAAATIVGVVLSMALRG